MKYEDELKLSFYKEIASVNESHGVKLVQHMETGKVYVRKTLKHYDLSVFEFIRERRFDGVPVIKDLIETDDALIVIEDYISGHSLDELIAEETFSEKKAARVISDLCDILEPFHSNTPQIIHRDIKESNVIIDNEGKVYLIDFDASKRVIHGRSRDTDLIGTEEYAAPEQYGFGQSDQRTDIYALGILLNRMLTGMFPSETRYNGDLSLIIDRATSIDPENRYSNVQRLKMALKYISQSTNYNAVRDEMTYCQSVSNDTLRRVLSHLPYLIRELPGFRSGNPWFFCLALLGYGFLIAMGFFSLSVNPEYSPLQNKFYDFATFLLLIVPILYLGNYLGVRDLLPWKKSNNRAIEYIRIGIGTIATILIVTIVVIIVAIILHV